MILVLLYGSDTFFESARINLHNLSTSPFLVVDARLPSYPPLKNLSMMPAQVRRARVELPVDRQAYRLAVKALNQITGRTPRHHPRYPQPQVLAHCDRAVVEQAVMQGTERQTVRHLVRSAMGWQTNGEGDTSGLAA